jgi:hypothetical protein
MNTDTPQTDAAINLFPDDDREYVGAEFARGLERENTELKRRLMGDNEGALALSDATESKYFPANGSTTLTDLGGNIDAPTCCREVKKNTTRLYYGDGAGDYLHRDVLRAAVWILDSGSPRENECPTCHRRMELVADPTGEKEYYKCWPCDEREEENQKLRDALKALYKADTMLRLRVCQRAPQIKQFSDWQKHTEALTEVEKLLKT